MSEQPSIHSLIEEFWESVPTAWRLTRTQIRKIAIENYSMTEEQFQLLRRIRRGYKSVSTLSEASQTTRSAVSRAVDALVRRGLVARSHDSDDRRNIPLALTVEGQRIMAGIYNETEQWLSVRFGYLSSKELADLSRGLEILHQTFTNS